MMAENYTYMKPNVLVRELARRGLFGEIYFGEGAYIHELKAGNERTKWAPQMADRTQWVNLSNT